MSNSHADRGNLGGVSCWAALGALLSALLMLPGCASAPGQAGKGIEPIPPQRLGTNAPAVLAAGLRDLANSVDPVEANLLAVTACRRSLELAREYHLVRPPIWHNLLINVGLKKRGLCYQWADDLTVTLQGLQLQTLQLRRGVARYDSWREHSCVVITASGRPFEDGLVLDAWRHSGRLFWCSVSADDYPWKEFKIPAELKSLTEKSH